MGSKLFDLTGKTALITGGGSGLGLAIARGLAEAGATAILNGRRRDKLEEAVAMLKAEGLRAGLAAFDVTDSSAVNAGVAEAVATHGTIDILVNNAGMQQRQPIEDFSDADWQRLLNTNLNAPFYVSRAVIPAMKAQHSGKIINICSVLSFISRPTIVPYATSKGGLAMFTKGTAVELASHNIQVNGIAPGFYKTEMNTALFNNPEFDGWVCKRTPAARWGDPHELVGAAVFLASAASSYVSGQIVSVDGGFTSSM
ncbi:MAG: SDR family oxidoreductase [Casimicrobiaceae bacterium]